MVKETEVSKCLPPSSVPSPRSALVLVYLAPCRFHSTDVFSGSFHLCLGLSWQGSTAELPALAQTLRSLFSSLAAPGRMWPAVTRGRVE